jgi:predicted transcriptional regulator YheO
MKRNATVECQCIKNKFRQYHTTDLCMNMDISTLEAKAIEVSQNVWHLSPRDIAPHPRRSVNSTTQVNKSKNFK